MKSTIFRMLRPLAIWMAVGTMLITATGDPPAVDTDGDGWPDAAEYFLGTDPLNPESTFAIRQVVRLQAPARTELRWPSVNGRSYRLEASDSLFATNWQTVITLTGTGGTLTHTVLDSAFPNARFFRLATEYDTALPPYVGTIDAPHAPITSPGPVVLRIQAWHPNGVDEVIFRRGGRILGAAILGVDGWWELVWTPDVTDNGTEDVIAEAHCGNTVTIAEAQALEVNLSLPPQPEYLSQNYEQFVLLDGQGQPRGGAPVRADAAGNLPPCEFRPMGSSVAGSPGSFAIRFPNGAHITDAAGSPTLEFSNARLVSGAWSPLTITDVIQVNGSRTLPLGPVTVAQLVSLFNLPASNGIPVKIAGHFPARLTGGTFSPAGFASPQIQVDPGVLPFGQVLGAFNGLTLELGERGFVKLPLSGTFPLAQIGGPPATLTIGNAEPAWARFGFDGSLALAGQGTLEFADGPTFEVELSLDGPAAGFGFRVGKLQARLSGDWLAAHLPLANTLNAGTPANVPTLNAAELSLERKAFAFERFASAFSASNPLPLPRPDAGLLPSPLDVAGWSKLAGATGLNADATELQAALQQAVRAAAASRNPQEAVRHWLAVERLRLSGLATAGLDALQTEVRAAARHRLETTERPLDLTGLNEILQNVAASLQLAQTTGGGFDLVEVQPGLEQAIVNALGAHAASLGVMAGQKSAASPALQVRNRFLIYQDLRTLALIQQDVQMLGLEIPPSALLEELLVQSGLALEPKLRAALHDAELAVDDMAFLDAMAEYLFLNQLEQLGVFANVPIGLLSVQSLSDRVGAMATALEALPIPQRPVAKRFHEVKRLGEILAAIPANVTYPAAPVLRAYHGLTNSIESAVGLLSTADRAELLAILRAGNIGAEIRDRMQFPAGSPAWEDATRISAVTDALAAKCLNENDPQTAKLGVDSLLAAAGRLTNAAQQTIRKTYLLEAQKLVTTLRTLAGNRLTPPPAADALLAGGIAVDELAGGLTYDARSRELTGWGSGQVRLPGMGASFTMSRIAFSSGGAFELNCHGSVTLPPGTNGPARFTVTERRPLRFAWQRPNHFSIAGSGQLEVNGMTFEAWATLDDPEYAFGASASGVNFDLADSLRVMVPTFPSAPNFAPAVRRDLLNYVRSMSGNLDTLRADLNPPTFREAGEMPDFSLGENFGPFRWIESTLDQFITDDVLNVASRNYSNVISKVVTAINSLEGQLTNRNASADCRSEAAFLEMHETLEILHRIERVVQANPGAPGMALLQSRATQLRAALAPRLVCASALDMNDSTENIARRLALLWQYGPPDQQTMQAITNVAEALPQFLLKFGIDPATGQPTDPNALAATDFNEIMLAFTVTAQMQAILQIGGWQNTVPGYPGVELSGVMRETWNQMGRAPWSGKVTEGRDLLAENDRLATALASSVGPEGFLAADDPLLEDSRRLGERLRQWAAEMMSYEKTLEMIGVELPTNAVPRVVGPDRPLLSATEDVAAALSIVLGRELDPTTTNYHPARVVKKWSLAGTNAPVISMPLVEGFQGTATPYGAPGRRALADLSNAELIWESIRPPETAPPAIFAAWKQAKDAALELGLNSALLPPEVLPALASQLQLEIENYLLKPSLPDAIRLARASRDMMIWLHDQGGFNPNVEALKPPLAQLDNAFKLLVVARQAWWHLSEYASIFVDGSLNFADQTAGSLGRYFGASAESSLGLGFQLIDDLGALLPSTRPVDLALPGGLRIDQVFGEVRYNHQSNLLSGSFGGSLTFPDIDANFTLTELTLDSVGHLSLRASASGPLPKLPGARLNGSINLAGQFRLGAPGQPPVAIQSFVGSGSGTATLPNGKTFTGSLAYDSTARTLALTTSAQMDLALGDHFALLNGNAGLHFGGVGPNAFPSSGRFEFGGTFGLLRKSSPPSGQPLTPEHFHLAAVNALARLEVNATTIALSLPQGKLLLPEWFNSPPVPPATEPQRAELAINPVQPPQITFALGAPDANGFKPLTNVVFAGGVIFTNLGLTLPDFPEVGARNFNGAFDFGSLSLGAFGTIPASTAPKLTINNGFVFFPHPIETNAIEIEAQNVVWQLDGFPTGTLSLATNVNLFNAGGFELTVLGAPGTPTTGLEIFAPSSAAQLPSLRLFGQLRLLVDNTLLTRETNNPAIAGIPAGRFGAMTGGELTIHAPVGNALPQIDFALSDVSISGDFRIGGANGVQVIGLSPGTPASIQLSGLGNLFSLADQAGHQFIVTLNGKIAPPNLPAFGLGDSRFVFFSYTQPPRFEPGTLLYDGSNWSLAQQLPVELRQAQLQFINNTLPWEQLLAPTNVLITTTFRLGFPSVDNAIIGGGADNVRVTFSPEGIPQLQNLEGIELTLDPGLKIPPIEELGGSVYVTGFSNPANLLLAGRLGGSINGYKLKFIVAFRSTGPLGLAVDFNAGSAGIPLGPTGFLFTGAGGGISYLPSNADPMDFRSYVQEVGGKFQANPTNPPPAASMTWNSFKEWGDKILAQTPTFPLAGTGPKLELVEPGDYPANDPIGCPVDIPPVTANIFGMPHPDQVKYPGRFILKFSSIPEDTLNKPLANGGMGITREFIESLNQSGTALAQTLATRIYTQITNNLPPVPIALGSGLQQAMQELGDQLRTEFTTAFTAALATAGPDSQAIYEAIREKAYAGVPVQDATFKVKGVFTHTAISSFLNVEGGGTIGTTGSAGVSGAVNFFGVPVGVGELYLSATDANGNPNPQLSGNLTLALGPLEFGSVKAVLKADGAMTGLAAVVSGIATSLGQPLVNQIMANVNPDYVGLTLAQAEAAVTQGISDPVKQAERLATFHAAFIAQVLRLPPNTLNEAVIDQIATLFDQVNPELVICADSSVKLAGLKLGNGLASMKYRMRKTGREAYFDIAPAGFIGYGTPLVFLTSGLDRASLAYAETFPDATGLIKRLLNGKLSSPAAWEAEARNQVRNMLENSVITGTYEVNPLGMTLFRAQARLINPDLTAHPVTRSWERPGTGTLANLPTREDLLLKAVQADVLGDVFWKGTTNQLAALYDDQIPDLQNRTLTHDYFPHGGLAMAAMLEVPRILATLPRAELATLLNESAAPVDRLNAMRTIMSDYFGTTVQQGNFMAYLPLPNPPALFDANGNPIVPPPTLDPLDLINSLKTFDPETAHPGSLWDLGESFVFLNLEGQLLDLPIATTKLTAVGPNPGTGAPAMFSGNLHFASNSWAGMLLGANVDIVANIAGQARPNRRLLATAFADLQALDTFGPSPSPSAVAAAIHSLATNLTDVIAQDLPAVELTANVNAWTPPAAWGWANKLTPQGTFSLAAYTPEFLRELPPTPTDRQRLQKSGGIALNGTFQLGNLITTEAQCLVTPPIHGRPRPHVTAHLTGRTVNLPAPFDQLLINTSLVFDSEAANFITASGTLSGSVTVTLPNGWSVTVPAGASVGITNHQATVRFTSGGATATLTANYANPLVPTFTFSGTLEFSPFGTGNIGIVPQPGTGSKLLVTLSGNNGLLSNARVVLNGFFGGTSANLPPLTVDNALNFAATSIATPLNGIALAGFSTTSLTWRVQRVNSVLSVNNISFTAPLPAGFNSGVFTVSGGTFAPNNVATLPVTTLPSLSLGRFAIVNNGGQPALTVNGLSLPAPQFTCADLGINLSLPGGALVLPPNGNFTRNGLSVPALTLSLGSLNGFQLNGVFFDLVKSGTTMNLQNFQANLPVPGFTPASVTLNGTVPSSGAISFTGAAIPQLGIDKISIKGANGSAITSTLSSAAGLVFAAGSLDVANLFTSPVNFPSPVNLSVPSSTAVNHTFATFTAAPNLRGFALGNSTIGFERTNSTVRLNISSGNLPLPGGSMLINFNGTITSAGAVSLNTTFNGQFYNFPVSANFTLANDTMSWVNIMNNSNPRAWWRMDEANVLKLSLANAASSGSTHNGSTTSTTTRPLLQQPSGFQDGSGSIASMRFDGVDDFYSVPSHPNLQGGNIMSVACWFRVNQFTPGKAWHTLLAMGDDSWRIAQDNQSNWLSFDTTDTGGNYHVLSASSAPINDDKWHHVVATFDGHTKRIYIDGVLRNAATWNATIKTSSYPVGIGYNPQVAGRNWNGWLDEAAFWNRALSPAEIHRMYERGNGLRLTFNGTANLRPSAPVFQPSFDGSVNASGEFEFSSHLNDATLLGFGFANLDVTFQRRLLPSSTATLTATATLQVPQAYPGSLPFPVLNIAPQFDATFTSTAHANSVTLTASNVMANIYGYKPKSPGYTLQLSGNLGSTKDLILSGFKFGPFGDSELTDINLNPPTGTISSDGLLSVGPFNQLLKLRNQTANNATIAFYEGGLVVDAPFQLKTTLNGITRNWGTISFSGLIEPSGRYDLAGNGSIEIGNNPRFTTTSFDMRFQSPGLGAWTVAPASGIPKPKLFYGAVQPEVENFGIHADGFTFSAKLSGAQDWQKRSPLPFRDYLFWVLDFDFDFNADRLDGNISAETDWKWQGIYPPSGFPPHVTYGPEHIVKLRGKVGTDGKLFINGPAIVSGTWPVNLSGFDPFGGWAVDGWKFFDFSGSGNGADLFNLIAPSRERLW